MHSTRLASVRSLRTASSWTGKACFLLMLVAGFAVTAAPAASPDAAPADRSTPEPLLKQVAQLGADRWHALGCRGRGVKVAILDSGFRDYREYLGKTLPERVTVKSFRRDADLEARNSQHGIYCAEVIHDLAPDAELLLANWEPEDSGQFLKAVEWAREQGARVLSCSVIEPSWSDGEGGGPVHETLSKLLGDGGQSGDLLFFASAGNTARRHWGGLFHDDGKGLHEWCAGHTSNPLTPWGTERVSVELSCQAGAGYEVQVYDLENGAEVVSATLKEGCSTAARFQPQAGHRYDVRLHQAGGRGGAFHCVALGAALEYSTTSGSVCFPADGPSVVAVGAVDADGQRMDYSSCGPNSSRPKPDLVAPVPFPLSSRAKPFGGTSAAAPQAAALAALIWARHGDWNAGQVRTTLRDSARHLGRAGCNSETGYGIVRLLGENEKVPLVIDPKVAKP